MALLVVVALSVVGCVPQPRETTRDTDPPPPTGARLTVNPVPNPEVTGWHGGILEDPLPRPDFTLTDTSGQPYDFGAETAGEVTLLFFGYTHCPDVCPAHMASIATALEQTGLEAGQDVEVVFVTADPERDTPERLRDWLDHFGEAFVGLTDPRGGTVDVMVDLGLPPPTITELEHRDGYLVGHPAQVIAFTADDLAHLVYPFGVGAGAFIADLPRLVSEGFST